MNNYTIQELQDYSLNFERKRFTPNLISLCKEDNSVGSVRIIIQRDGSNTYQVYHSIEGFRFELDSNHTLADAKNHLVQFHIKNYEK